MCASSSQQSLGMRSFVRQRTVKVSPPVRPQYEGSPFGPWTGSKKFGPHVPHTSYWVLGHPALFSTEQRKEPPRPSTPRLLSRGSSSLLEVSGSFINSSKFAFCRCRDAFLCMFLASSSSKMRIGIRHCWVQLLQPC